MKEVNILSGMQLDLLSLSKVIHYLTDSSSTIHYGNESINKVTLLEFEDIVNKRKLTKKFISQVKSTIDSSPA